MWDLISNPIVTHLGAAFAGAGLAWYATHKTAVAVFAAALKSDVATVGAAIKKL